MLESRTMPGGSLLALLDDITTILDNVGALTKVATEKTAGVLGDDLALNAQQVSGVEAERELPVVWAVAKGSARNKLILVPLALIISSLAPWLVMPLLMFGGAFLCYEGVHKWVDSFLQTREQATAEDIELLESVADPNVDLVQAEADQIAGAIRTDFVLSAEIVAISLGTVATASLETRIVVLTLIAALMTVGVYGLVAAIVKLDDMGAAMATRPGRGSKRLGAAILAFAPWLMRFLGVAGTIAMFMVGGGILVHGLAPVAAYISELQHEVGAIGWLVGPILKALFGVMAGMVAVAFVMALSALYRKARG